MNNQTLLERLEKAETLAAIREGIEQSDRGEAIPLEVAADRLRRKYGSCAKVAPNDPS